MHNKVIIYPWPHSQLCMDCEKGEFVQSETFSASDYICAVNSIKNTGTRCPDRVPKKGGDPSEPHKQD